MIEIEKNVPIPDSGKFGYRAAMRKMDVGNSALFTGSTRSIYSTAQSVLGPGNYRTKISEGGIRVWRIK